MTLHYPSRLRLRRIAAGLTLKELAERVGYSYVWISKVERGLCRPAPELMKRINANIEDASRYRSTFRDPVLDAEDTPATSRRKAKR